VREVPVSIKQMRAQAESMTSISNSIKDRHGLKIVDYLHPDSSETDKSIVQMIREAIREQTMGGVANNADLADSDDGAPGSGSESD